VGSAVIAEFTDLVFNGDDANTIVVTPQHANRTRHAGSLVAVGSARLR
jgi:hypothetical protein